MIPLSVSPQRLATHLSLLQALQADRDAHTAWKIYTPPAAEPVLLDEAKNHCRVDEDITEDDSLIEGLVTAARMHIEEICSLALITQTWTYKLDLFPYAPLIKLPIKPLQSVASITYTLADGSTSTLSGSSYVVDTDSEPPRILLKSGYSWPTDELQSGPSVAVRFVAGYGADGSSVPRPLLQALLLLVGNWYENREAMLDTRGQLMALPFAVDSLVIPWRVWL